jgi:hypothetical protein
MHDRAVARQRGGFHDVVVPIDRKRLGFLVDQYVEEREQILRIQARRRGCEPARNVAVADNLGAAGFGHRVSLDAFDIAAALDRKIDDH